MLVDEDQAIAVRVRQRTQQHRVGECEDCAIGADAQRQGEADHSREARRRAHLPQGAGDVLAQFVKESGQPHLAISLSAQVHTGPLEFSEVADARQHEVTRRAWIHPALDELARPHLDVQRELLVHFLIEGNAPEPRTEGTLH